MGGAKQSRRGGRETSWRAPPGGVGILGHHFCGGVIWAVTRLDENSLIHVPSGRKIRHPYLSSWVLLVRHDVERNVR